MALDELLVKVDGALDAWKSTKAKHRLLYLIPVGQIILKQEKEKQND